MATNNLVAGLGADMGALPITAGADSKAISDLKSQISQRQSDIRGAETRLEEALRKSEATLTPLRESQTRAQKAELEATQAPLPTMKEARQPIPPDVRMPLDKLFMMIMTAAFASSAAGKKNYLAAASGLTGALEGIQNGQKEAAATALKQYDQAMKAALAEDQKNLRQYNAIMSQRNKDIQTKITEAKMYATQIQNEVHRSQLETGQIDRFIQNANNSVDTMTREVARLQQNARLAAERAQDAREREQRRAQQAKEMAELRASQKKGDTQRATQQTFIVQRAVNALGGVASALESIVEAPVGATTGWLPNLQTKDGMFNAIRNQIGRSVTEPEAEFMNTLFSGIGRNLASIEASGTATGLTALANQLQSGVYINAGVDDPYKVAIKLADIRRIATENIRPAIDSGIMPPQQAKAAENLIDRIEKVIPYTTKDVIQAYNEAQGKPSATLGKSARKAATGVTGTTKTPTPEEINRALQRIRQLEGKQ